MPYNNTAIPPPERITGSAALPLARVKKILQIDEDISQVSNNAAFAITLATEMFIRHLADQASTVAKAEAKPRRNLQYKDLATAITRLDALEFLSDIIPRTTTLREHREKRARETGAPGRKLVTRPLAAGQTTLDGRRAGLGDLGHEEGMGLNGGIGDGHGEGEEEEESGLERSRMEGNRPGTAGSVNGRVNGERGLVFEHFVPNGSGRGDVEMG